VKREPREFASVCAALLNCIYCAPVNLLEVGRTSQVNLFRLALGDAFSAGELLRLAASLVAAYKLERDERDYGGYRARDPFAAAAVDKAMTDGGWKILDFEHRAGMPMSDDIPENQLAVEARIKGFVGRAEWPRIEMAWR
jgi:hypothetical protein